MHPAKMIALSVICAVLAAVLYARFFIPNTEAVSIAQKEIAFERVSRTGALRCGYGMAAPWFMIDPKTQQMSGVNYDVTNAIGKKIGWKVEWVEETGWGVAEQGLIAGRYDMMCGNVCVDPRRAQAGTFTKSWIHMPLVAVVRMNDQRFDNDLSLINDPAVKVGVKNGHVFEFTVDETFPKAAKVYSNDIVDESEFYEMLTAHKIDVAFAAESMVDAYNEANPGSIRSIGEPVRYCNGAFIVPLGDEKMKHIIDNAIDELNTSNVLETIIRKHTKLTPRYVRLPVLPFR